MAEYSTEWTETHDPEQTTIVAPINAVRCDIVAIGPGGGADSSGHGRPGEWVSGTIATKVDIPCTIPPKSEVNPAPNTLVGSLLAPGGNGRVNGNWTNNARPAAYTAFGTTFDVVTLGTRIAGDGGLNGSNSSYRLGGAGAVWYRWWINPKIQNLYVGGKEVQAVYVGSTEVTAVYGGNKIVYGAA